MVYLCPRHQRAIQQDPTLAMTLWGGAMDNGVTAYRDGDWEAARNFFGSAYQTALLYTCRQPAPPTGQGSFRLEHLLDAGKLLSAVLRRTGRLEEAQICLLTLQNCLVQQQGTTGPAGNRTTTLALTEGLVDQLIQTHRLDRKLHHSQSLQRDDCPGRVH